MFPSSVKFIAVDFFLGFSPQPESDLCIEVNIIYCGILYVSSHSLLHQWGMKSLWLCHSVLAACGGRSFSLSICLSHHALHFLLPHGIGLALLSAVLVPGSLVRTGVGKIFPDFRRTLGGLMGFVCFLFGGGGGHEFNLIALCRFESKHLNTQFVKV